MLQHRPAQFWSLSWRFIAALLLFTLSAAGNAKDNTLVGKPAPDFALKSAAGANLRLSEFRGQVVMLNFWATWAGASRQEMPVLEKLHATYSSAGLVLLGVTVDEQPERAAEFARASRVSYPILFDTRKSVAPMYGLDTMPLTLLIDRAGIVRYAHVGFPTGAERAYVTQLRNLLDE